MVRSTRKMRRGFTLIELLVVIAIIAILVSITVPAVMQAIATADRARTGARLNQLALAINSYALAGGGSYPAGYDAGTGTTFYWAVRDLIEAGGGGAQAGTTPVDSFLCPARRRPSNCAPGTAPADYGYGDQGWGASVLSAPGGVTPTAVTNGRGASLCLLLGIIGLKPSQYLSGAADTPWKSCATYKRSPGSFMKDDDQQAMEGLIGGPFATGLPFAFCDRSVRMLRYDRFQQQNDQNLLAIWQYANGSYPVNQGLIE